MTYIRPTKLTELGMVFVKDPNCSDCPTGTCHNRASGKIGETEYFIHVMVFETYCTELCSSTEYNIEVSINSSTFSGDELSRKFFTEIEAVDYLLDTFVDFKCGTW